jgi:hypothetical protein
MRKPGPALSIVTALMFMAAAIGSAETVTVDGVPHVRNGGQPRDGKVDLHLRELWRAGAEDDEVFFGLVPRVVTDDQGNVYVLDSQTCQVFVYSPEGELLRTLFRQGEGPGEVQRPRDMLLMGDGRVGLIQEFPGAISFVQNDGSPAGKFRLVSQENGVVSLTSCLASGEVLILSGSTQVPNPERPEIQKNLNFLERRNPDGTYLARYAENANTYDFSDFLFTELHHLPLFWFTFAAAPDGQVFLATRHQDYAIEVRAADGELTRVIEREYEPLDRTAEELHRLELIILSAFNGAPFQPRLEIEKREPALSFFHRAIQLHPDGSLWVLSGRGVRPQEPGVMAVFDIFDQAGVFTRQVAMHADHDARDVGIFLSGSNRVLVVKGYMDSLAAQFGNGTALSDEGYEPQAPEVICYELDSVSSSGQ